MIDGSLFISPFASVLHQVISSELVHLPARAREFRVLGPLNLRLKRGRILIPDIVITSPFDLDVVVAPVEAVRLVCEITSPSDEAHDKVLKMHY
ncbi:Uma2 family endonuclease [Micromonospora sp. CPCC 206061]|uniref:Uma2 family endonuclease n=1 Tax=Micromonospora sp. CPCC 206061 TaxID=3122410 RepID=UPI002FF1E048